MITPLRLQRMFKYPKAKDFAEQVGISNAYLSRLETGDRKKPSPEIREKIAELLGVDEKSLF